MYPMILCSRLSLLSFAGLAVGLGSKLPVSPQIYIFVLKRNEAVFLPLLFFPTPLRLHSFLFAPFFVWGDGGSKPNLDFTIIIACFLFPASTPPEALHCIHCLVTIMAERAQMVGRDPMLPNYASISRVD